MVGNNIRVGNSSRAALATDRLLLRDFAADDLHALHRLESDPLAVQYQPYPPHSLEDSRSCLRSYVEAAENSPRSAFHLALALRSDEQVVGRCSLRIRASGPGADAALACILARGCWGQGLMSEAMRRVISFGFEELGIRRVWANTDVRNGRMNRLNESVGLRREAHFRENVFIKGAWRDTFGFAVLKDEWPAGKMLEESGAARPEPSIRRGPPGACSDD